MLPCATARAASRPQAPVQTPPTALLIASNTIPAQQRRSFRRRRHRLPPRAAANDGPPQQLLLASPEQQVPAFSALALLHSGLAGAMTFAPGWGLGALLGLRPTPVTCLQMVGVASHFWLLVAVLLCLKDAASHGRLGSETYKRLGLGVMYTNVVLLVLLAKHRALLGGGVLCGAAAVFAATALVAGRVYAASAGGFSLPVVARSFASNLRSLLSVPPTPSSGFYAACAALALVQFVALFPSPAPPPLFAADVGEPAAVLLKQAAGAGMVLSGAAWFSLKDAADRGRLAASTFRLLNLAAAVASVLQLWALWRMAALGLALNEPLWRALVGAGLLAVAVCDLNYFFA